MYYMACFFSVDLEAAKVGLHGMTKESLPIVSRVLRKDGYLLLPIACLIYCLGIANFSAQRSAVMTIVCVLALSMFRADTRVTPKKFFQAMTQGAMSAMEIGVVCGCAGMLIGVILRSGLGSRLTGLLVELSGGCLPVLMVLTMICSFILGMGMPTSACYIIVATMIAPAMIKMGWAPLAAHMFVFYYGCLSAITPPVAVAAYAGAAIAKCSPIKAGWQAVRFGLCGFIIRLCSFMETNCF